MKQLIGKDIGNYVFDKTAKTITFSNVSFTQEQILLITNTTTQTIIYSFADSTLGGILIGSVLTLNFDTTSMSNTDKLQIYVDIPDTTQLNVLDELQALNTDSTLMLRCLISILSNPVYLDATLNALRIAIVSGSVTISSGTVTTVNTVANQTNIGGKSADMVTGNLSDVAWSNSIRQLLS